MKTKKITILLILLLTVGITYRHFSEKSILDERITPVKTPTQQPLDSIPQLVVKYTKENNDYHLKNEDSLKGEIIKAKSKNKELTNKNKDLSGKNNDLAQQNTKLKSYSDEVVAKNELLNNEKEFYKNKISFEKVVSEKPLPECASASLDTGTKFIIINTGTNDTKKSGLKSLFRRKKD
jgi:hypothetical protein